MFLAKFIISLSEMDLTDTSALLETRKIDKNLCEEKAIIFSPRSLEQYNEIISTVVNLDFGHLNKTFDVYDR